jgi:hypothetical protein
VSYSNLIRLGGLGAMVGGVGYAGVGLLEVHLGEELVYIGNIGYRFIVVSLPLGTMAAIVALYGPAQGTLRSSGGGVLPDGRSRASASNGGVNPQGSSHLSDMPFRT